MSLHPREFAGLLIAVLLLPTAMVPPARAQTPAGRPAAEGLTPEQMVKSAIEKIEMGDLAAAAPLLQQAAVLKPTLNILKLGQGLFYVASKRGPEAINALGTYNQTDEGKRDYRGFAAVGKVYLQASMFRQAMFPLEQAMKMAPNEKDGKPLRADITLDLARAYVTLNDGKKAIELVKKAQSSTPNDGEIQLRISEIAGAVNEWQMAGDSAKRAVELLKRKIRDDPFNQDAYAKLKRSYQLLGNLHIQNVNKDPDNGEHFHQYALVLEAIAQINRKIGLLKARDMALKAIEKDPKNSKWQLLAVRLEMELGGRTQAKARLDTILQAEPKNAEALRLKQRLAATPQRTASS